MHRSVIAAAIATLGLAGSALAQPAPPGALEAAQRRMEAAERATEARVARAARDYVVNTRGHRLNWTKAAGYWLKGVADADQKSID